MITNQKQQAENPQHHGSLGNGKAWKTTVNPGNPPCQ